MHQPLPPPVLPTLGLIGLISIVLPVPLQLTYPLTQRANPEELHPKEEQQHPQATIPYQRPIHRSPPFFTIQTLTPIAAYVAMYPLACFIAALDAAPSFWSADGAYAGTISSTVAQERRRPYTQEIRRATTATTPHQTPFDPRHMASPTHHTPLRISLLCSKALYEHEHLVIIPRLYL